MYAKSVTYQLHEKAAAAAGARRYAGGARIQDATRLAAASASTATKMMTTNTDHSNHTHTNTYSSQPAVEKNLHYKNLTQKEDNALQLLEQTNLNANQVYLTAYKHRDTMNS